MLTSTGIKHRSVMGTYRYQAILAGVLVLVGLYPPHANATIYRCTTPGKPDSYQSTPCDALYLPDWSGCLARVGEGAVI